MASDFCLVMHAAEGQSDELPAQSARNGLAQRSLADARRSDEAQDRALHIRFQASHREIVKDAVFDFLKIIVIGVENFLGLGDVYLCAGGLGPWQHSQPLDVIAGE